MKVIVALFLCTLVLSATAQAVDLDLSCLLSQGGCDLVAFLTSKGISLTSSYDLALNNAIGTAVVNINSTISINSLSVTAGVLMTGSSTLNVAQGAQVTLASALSVTGNAFLNVSGQVVVSGVTVIGTTSGFIANSGAVVTFEGGVNVDSSATGTNQGLVVNSGASVTIAASSTINGALTLAQNSIFIISSGVVTSALAISSAANTTVAGTLTFTSSTASYTQTAGYLLLGSSLSANPSIWASVDSSVTINSNALLSGVGNITGDLTISGTISVGNSPGTVYCNGNYAMSSTSTFDLEIASATSYDRVIVQGNAALNGILYAKLLSNYQPRNGEQYTCITAIGTTSGDFIVHGDYNSNLNKYTHNVFPHSVVVTYNSAASVGISLFLIAVSFTIVTL